MDKYSGHSGTFVVGTDGTRARASLDAEGFVTIPAAGDAKEQKLHRPLTLPHPEGDAPRNEKGERVDRGADQQAAAAPQPAMPEPAKVAPWATPTTEDKKGE